jgi:hypothetical protein
MDGNDIYLVNYRHINCEPLKSITQLPEKEAYELAEKLYKESHAVLINVLAQILKGTISID